VGAGWCALAARAPTVAVQFASLTRTLSALGQRGKEPRTPTPWRLTLRDENTRFSTLESTGYTGFVGCFKKADPGLARRRRFFVDLGTIYGRTRTDEEVAQAISENDEAPYNARRKMHFPLGKIRGKDSATAVDWLTESMGENKGGVAAQGYRTRACILRFDSLTGRVHIICPHEQMLAPPIDGRELKELRAAGADAGIATCALGPCVASRIAPASLTPSLLLQS
jgi:hypothetical protein